jgi:hypothetical protein
MFDSSTRINPKAFYSVFSPRSLNVQRFSSNQDVSLKHNTFYHHIALTTLTLIFHYIKYTQVHFRNHILEIEPPNMNTVFRNTDASQPSPN